MQIVSEQDNVLSSIENTNSKYKYVLTEMEMKRYSQSKCIYNSRTAGRHVMIRV